MSLLTLMSWNMQHQIKNWETVLSSGVDVALLQEAKLPPSVLLEKLKMDFGRDDPAIKSHGRAAVVGLSHHIDFTPIQTQPLGGDNRDAIMVSRAGTFAPARVRILKNNEEIVVVSLC